MIAEDEDSVLSDEDDCKIVPGKPMLNFEGILSKWTNYIHGWQNRFIVLEDSTLTYYKSRQEKGYGYRGAISVLKANVKAHEFDECRFDVSVKDCVWYLRAENAEEKNKWLEYLDKCKHESGYGSQDNLQRHGSSISVSSNTLSTTSTSSFKKGKGLKIKLAELETYRDILVNQIDTLQTYFDDCASSNGPQKLNSESSDPDATPTPDTNPDTSPFFSPGSNERHVKESNETRTVDFRGEALTFKATTAGIITCLSHCIEYMTQRDEYWKRRIGKEIEKRKKLEELFKQQLKEIEGSGKFVVMGGPDCEEGPHSALNEDEFYDAVELGLDRLEEEEEFRQRLKSIQISTSPVSQAKMHPRWDEIDKVTMEQLHYARLPVGEGGWELFAEEGEMKMYKREEEKDGLVVDPLKAVHTVKGVTGKEMCHYFFSPDYRYDWETTIEQMNILERISEDTMIFLQIHKRIWPAAQRDALFWSHIRKVRDKDSEEDMWIVCNNSTNHDNDPKKPSGKYIRVFLTVCMVCQTDIKKPQEGKDITRDDISCRITYCSVVNPGGWAPASVLRSVYKREYPKFLRKFTHYVYDQCKNKPIML